MTDRTNHIIAVSLMVAGIAAGGVCWALDGLPFWILAGVSAALVIAGLIFAGHASPSDKKDGGRKK